MTVMHEVEFEYEVGEEVVFRLNVVDGGGPAWSIGEIVERRVAGGRPTYTVRFRDGDAPRAVAIAEEAIEGTA